LRRTGGDSSFRMIIEFVIFDILDRPAAS